MHSPGLDDSELLRRARVDASAFAALYPDRHLSALRDERLEASAHATTWIAGAAGKQPRDAVGGRTWLVGGHRVTGFTAADGSFCFRCARGAGGCLAEPGLSLATPVTVMSDNAPGTLRVYGLAMDGITAVSLRARGVTRRAAMGRNAFYLGANALGSRKGFAGTLIVRYGGGTTRLVSLRIGGYERRTPKTASTTARPRAGRGYGGLTAALRGPVRRSGGAGPGASCSGAS